MIILSNHHSGHQIEPRVEKSWEALTQEVTALDEGLVGGLKEDINTLLVFVRALFSSCSRF